MKWMSVVFLPPDGDSFFFSFPFLPLVWVGEWMKLIEKLVCEKLAADGGRLPQGYVDVASRGPGGCPK